MLCLPPHTSHKMQPLDVAVMKPLKTYYSQECTQWMKNHPGRTITLKCIGEIFGKAYLRAAAPINAINSFKCTGIHPLNQYIFQDKDFVQELSANTSQTSGPLEEVIELRLPVVTNDMIHDRRNITVLCDTTNAVIQEKIDKRPVESHDASNDLIVIPSTSDASTSKVIQPQIEERPIEIQNSNKIHKKLKGKSVIITSNEYLEEIEGNKKVNIKKENQSRKVQKENKKQNLLKCQKREKQKKKTSIYKIKKDCRRNQRKT